MRLFGNLIYAVKDGDPDAAKLTAAKILADAEAGYDNRRANAVESIAGLQEEVVRQRTIRDRAAGLHAKVSRALRNLTSNGE